MVRSPGNDGDQAAFKRVDTVRQQHFERLAAKAIMLPWTVIRAPIGYGKTLLARQIATTSTDPLAWCTLAPECSELELISELTRSLAAAWPDAGVDPASIRDQSARAQLAEILPVIGDGTIVLDDAHHATPTILDTILNTLEVQPIQSLRVVVTTEGPATPRLLRDEAIGQVAAIGATDLAFSEADCSAMLDDESGGRALHNATGGWPIGVLLRARGAIRGTALPADASLLQLALGLRRRLIASGWL